MVDEINFGSSFGVIKARLTVSISCLRRIINHKCLPHFSFKTIKDIIFLRSSSKKFLVVTIWNKKEQPSNIKWNLSPLAVSELTHNPTTYTHTKSRVIEFKSYKELFSARLHQSWWQKGHQSKLTNLMLLPAALMYPYAFP